MFDERRSRDIFATGNAAALQKIELEGFTEAIQVWAWDSFRRMARAFAIRNAFSPDDASALAAEALTGLLRKKNLALKRPNGIPPEDFLQAVMAQQFRRAATLIADERSVWTESCCSLDAPCTLDVEDAEALGDSVTDDTTFNTTRKFLTLPRAIALRQTLRHLQNTKDRAGLAALRAQLNAKDDTLTAHKDNDTHPSAVRRSSFGFGLTSAASNRFVLAMDTAAILATLPPRLRKLCRLMMTVENPKTAYKCLGIKKNAYFRHVLPLLRQVFAELADAY